MESNEKISEAFFWSEGSFPFKCPMNVNKKVTGNNSNSRFKILPFQKTDDFWKILIRQKFLRRKECWKERVSNKFREWPSVGNRIAYGQLFRARSRYVIFANVPREIWLSIVLSFFLPPTWKRAAFCYRKSEQQPPARVFLYIGRDVETRYLVIGRRKWPPKTGFHLLGR